MASQYIIDFNWYKDSKRSFSTLVQSRLCKACQNKIKVSKATNDELVLAIKDCCSKNTGFITSKMPLLEIIFRIFLANGNEPLSAEQVFQELEECRGEGSGIAPHMINRLLDNERYYGFHNIQEEEEEIEEFSEPTVTEIIEEEEN
jgi:hypothetical protein